MSYCALILYTETPGSGGHIFDQPKHRSLCGTEKRFPHIETGLDFFDEDFEEWFKTNKEWICQRCRHSYEKHLKKL